MIVGTSVRPRDCAARTRPWPAISVPASSTSTGTVKPHSRMEAAICWTCSCEWVRAFLAYGTSEASGRRLTASAGHCVRLMLATNVDAIQWVALVSWHGVLVTRHDLEIGCGDVQRHHPRKQPQEHSTAVGAAQGHNAAETCHRPL